MNIGKLVFETHKNEFHINGWERVAGIIPESYKQQNLKNKKPELFLSSGLLISRLSSLHF